MLLYCLGQTAFFGKVRSHIPTLLAYANDLLIVHDDPKNAHEVVDQVATLARERGLTINMDKCRSSQLGHKVSFLGAPVAREKLSIAAEAVGKGRAQGHGSGHQPPCQIDPSQDMCGPHGQLRTPRRTSITT